MTDLGPADRRERLAEVGPCLSYAGLVIACDCDNGDDFAWLCEFLEPWFRRADGTAPDRTVTFRADAERHRALTHARLTHARLGHAPQTHARLAHAGAERPLARLRVFALDSGWQMLNAWQQDGELAVYDDSYDAYYLVSHAGRATTIVTSGDSPYAARRALMRVVREYAMSHTRRQPGVMIHGAAFVLSGRCVAVVGPKRAGKTSFLLHALGTPGVAMVANDRVWAGSVNNGDPGSDNGGDKSGDDGSDNNGDGGPVAIVGMPTITTLRDTTLAMFPDLQERIRTGGFWDFLTTDEACQRKAGAAGLDRYGRYNISAAQLGMLMDRPLAVGGGLSCILFPFITGQDGGVAFHRLSPAQARERLSFGLFGERTNRSGSAVFDGVDGQNGQLRTSEASLDGVCDRTPAFLCTLGRDAFADRTWAPRLLASLG